MFQAPSRCMESMITMTTIYCTFLITTTVAEIPFFFNAMYILVFILATSAYVYLSK